MARPSNHIWPRWGPVTTRRVEKPQPSSWMYTAPAPQAPSRPDTAPAQPLSPLPEPTTPPQTGAVPEAGLPARAASGDGETQPARRASDRTAEGPARPRRATAPRPAVRPAAKPKKVKVRPRRTPGPPRPVRPAPRAGGHEGTVPRSARRHQPRRGRPLPPDVQPKTGAGHSPSKSNRCFTWGCETTVPLPQGPDHAPKGVAADLRRTRPDTHRGEHDSAAAPADHPLRNPVHPSPLGDPRRLAGRPRRAAARRPHPHLHTGRRAGISMNEQTITKPRPQVATCTQPDRPLRPVPHLHLPLRGGREPPLHGCREARQKQFAHP